MSYFSWCHCFVIIEQNLIENFIHLLTAKYYINRFILKSCDLEIFMEAWLWHWLLMIIASPTNCPDIPLTLEIDWLQNATMTKKRCIYSYCFWIKVIWRMWNKKHSHFFRIKEVKIKDTVNQISFVVILFFLIATN